MSEFRELRWRRMRSPLQVALYGKSDSKNIHLEKCISLLFIKTTVRGWICGSVEENKINTETCWEAAT